MANPSLPTNLADSFEKISIRIEENATTGSKWVARQIAQLIQTKQKKKQKVILGLATGSTPKSLYAELVRLHKEEGLSFKNVVTFNLDEYYPIEKEALQSYHRFMHLHLFDHIDINPKNIHIPIGETEKEKIKDHCNAYEKKIADHGGIDLQILGIGNNGHIGFNEPGSGIHTKTRLTTLDNSTRLANSYEFANIAQVPRLAITMGISTILKSKKIILMAWGSAKAPVIKQAVEEEMTEGLPASLLQQHEDVQFVIDQDAASELTRYKSPWLTGECEWTPKLIKKAVVNMALKLKKPVLSLTNTDYNEYGLGDLLVEKGDAYEINLQVYYMLRDTLTGWPAGKPNAHIPAHPERSSPWPKRVVIFSPTLMMISLAWGVLFNDYMTKAMKCMLPIKLVATLQSQMNLFHAILILRLDLNLHLEVPLKKQRNLYKTFANFLLEKNLTRSTTLLSEK